MLAGKWHIWLIGSLQLRQQETVLSRFRTQKAAELLAFLALHKGQSFSRDFLTELLWPETEIDAGRMRLRQELASLRRQLESPGAGDGVVLLTTRSTVQLNPLAFETDVEEFRLCVSDAQKACDEAGRALHLRRALEEAGGEPLSGILSDWAQEERARLEREILRVHRDLAESERAIGRAEEAEKVLRAAVSRDPLDEEIRRALIRLLAESGRRGEAKREFETFRDLMRRRLDEEPSAETAAAMLAEAGAPAPHELERGRTPRTVAGRSPERHPRKRAKPSPGPSPTDSRLPLPLARFFGREQELDRLLRMLSGEARLVTLTGPGGAGKTRLAVEAATRLGTRFGEGLLYLPLADLDRAGRIAPALLEALQRPAPSGEDLRSQAAAAAAALTARPFLLVLDNFEHLLEEGAGLVAEMLSQAPELVCLVTSRRLLRIEGEREFPVDPLPLPPGGVTAALEVAAGSPAVQLFTDRARGVRPDFALRAGNVGSIVKLCEALEGMPLSLELAAGWVRAMTPAEMLHCIGGEAGRLGLLVNRKSHTLHRHRSLRTALDSSYALLADEERQLFARLSVFRGGWTADAAERVAGGTLDSLLRLVESSLVVAEETATGTRFRMLETLREYAQEHLSGEEVSTIQNAHADHFADILEQAAACWRGPQETERLRRLDADYANVRAALAWSAGQSLPRMDRMLAALTHYWVVRGMAREGLEWHDQSHSRSAADTSLRARAAAGRGRLALEASDSDAAERAYLEARSLAKAAGDEEAESEAIAGEALVAYVRREYQESLEIHHRAYAVRLRIGDRTAIVRSLFNIAATHQARGDLDVSGRRFAECLTLAREISDETSIGMALTGIGFAERYLGRFTPARSHFLEALALHERNGNRAAVADVLHNLGQIACEQGHYEEAEELGFRSVDTFKQIGVESMRLTVQSVAATAAMYRGDLELAAERWGHMLAEAESCGDLAPVEIALRGLCLLDLLRDRKDVLREHLRRIRGMAGDAQHLEARRASLSELEGLVRARQGDSAGAREELEFGLRHWSEKGGDLPMSRLQRALAEWEERYGSPAEAARWLGAAAGLREKMGVPVHPVERPGLDSLTAFLKKKLGDSFDSHFSSGFASPSANA